MADIKEERVSQNEADEEAWVNESNEGWKITIVLSLLRLDTWRLEKSYLNRWNISYS